MRPPAKKKAVAKKVVRKPAAGAKNGTKTIGAKPRGTASPQPRNATLAGRIVTAPQLLDPRAARTRVIDWLAGLPAGEAKPLKARLAAHDTVNTLLASLAENSPYLWELASREPQRLLRLLDCDPDRHLADLLAEHGHAAASTADEAEAGSGRSRRSVRNT